MHRVLLVDVMDTLVHDPFEHEIPAFFGVTKAELIAIKHPTAWQEFESGGMSEAQFLASFFADGRTFDHERFLEVVRRGYRWMEGAEDMLASLARAGAEVHAFSNYPVWYRRIEEKLALSRYLDWTFVSCLTGFRKPDERAYRNACARLGRAPESCVFLDDREINCAAAERIGMPSVCFTDARSSTAELERLGLFAPRAPRGP